MKYATNGIYGRRPVGKNRGKYNGDWVEPILICTHCKNELGDNPFEIYKMLFCTYWCYREYKIAKRPLLKW